MHTLVFSLVKALALSLMAVASLITLGVSVPISLVFGFIVLMFGSLRVVDQLIYGLTALIVIAAACSLLIPATTIIDMVASAGNFVHGIASGAD